MTIRQKMGFPGDAVIKTLPANAGDARDTDLISGSGRSPVEGNGNPLQYSCLENPMDGGAWWATVGGVVKTQTRLSMHVRMHEAKKKSTSIVRIWCQSTEEIGSNMYIMRCMFLDLSYTHLICKYVFINIHILVHAVGVCAGCLTWSGACLVLVLAF